MKTHIRILQAWLASIWLLAWTCSWAAELNLATSPLFLGTSVDANVFFEVDDSGSMDWETLVGEFDYYFNYWGDNDRSKINHGRWESYASTGSSFTGQRSYGYMFAEADRLYQGTSLYGSNAEGNPEALQRDWRARSSDFNLLYYDPTVTYQPWVGLANADFTAARSDPQSGSDGYDSLRNLTGFVFEVAVDDHGYGGSAPDGPSDATDGANGLVDLWDSRVTYTVNADTLDAVHYLIPAAATIAALATDCDLADAQDAVPYEDCFGTQATSSSYDADDVNPWGRSLVGEKQNIANWYSYYRKRSYVAKASIAAVIDDADDFRYGLSLINDYADLFVEVPASDVIDYTSHNNNLLTALYNYDWEALGTPLRRGLERTGKYFDNDLTGKTDPIISLCQQNFTILLTDGYWSGSDPASAIGDADGDGRSRTLADVAKYYYDKDLSPLANNVPTSVIDGNSKQHMVTFGVAFGVVGDLVDTDGDGYPNPALAGNVTWGENPYSSEPGKIDDLWHAAYNSKGNYVAAQTPSSLVESLTTALAAISDRVGSSASVATNSGSLNAGSHLFQARFDSGGWSGQLIAFALNADGTLNPTPSWEASDQLDTQNYNFGRTIITFNPTIDTPSGGVVEGKGVPFRFPADYTSPSASADISPAQITALLKYAPNPAGTADAGEIAENQAYGAALLNYLRGDRSQENTGFGFRERNSALGDIVDSDPQYVDAPRFRYPDSLESEPYSTFKSTYADRPSMVYVGANDGMLHGFAETGGTEKLAYIPNQVFASLPELSEPDYIHRYFVNEPPTVIDAYLDDYAATGAWRTVLIGGLGKGGQGMYALDVTDPDNFLESNADDIALWEFNDSDDADLGFTFGSASIAKMHNGQWAAIFGNGYNNTDADGNASSTGHAVLYIVDIETGELIKKIDTGAGSVATPNGLSSPALVDVNQDFLVDYIYAGDLEGNLWKFDVSNANTNLWDVAYKQGANPLPLFTTKAGQPITTRPQVTTHPANLDGYMVYFGTGKYLESNDNVPAGSTTQAFYGIWDKDESNLTAFDTDDLLEQSITKQYAKGFDTDGDDMEDAFFNLRDVSDEPINFNVHMGWFMDLIPEKIEAAANSDNFGEKQVSNALVRDGRVIFTTLIPSQNLCDFGGSSFIMELDYRNGGQLEFPPFNLNGDDQFDSDDTYVGGSQTDVGIVSTLSIISDGDSETAFGSGSSGDVESVGLNVGDNALGRQSWRQIQ
jgi:type IV pilus assembly protein PilY1